MKNALALIGAAITCAGTSLAAPIVAVVTINGVATTQTFNPGAPIVLQLDGDTAPGVQPVANASIWIYDMQTGIGSPPEPSPPVSSIGIVTLRGAATTTANVTLLVSGATEGYFPSNPGDRLLSAGAVNFGGLVIQNLNDPADDSLARRTRLAMAVSGEISGNITVGQVFRVQAGDSTLDGANPVGTISANITGISPDLDILFGQSLVVFNVSAANAITGNITAKGIADASGLVEVSASILKVAVGSSTSAIGIRGNIVAAEGSIGQVLSTGGIGTPASPSTILAGNSITAIRSRSEADPAYFTRPLAKNIHAHITAGKKYEIIRPVGQTGRRFRQVPESWNGSLALLETAGNVTGSVNVLNLDPYSPLGLFTGFSRGEDDRAGISVRGDLDAPVKVWGVVNLADIIASRITQPVDIGLAIKGSIIAYGEPTPADLTQGSIKSVKIGLAAPIDQLYYGDDANAAPWTTVWQAGFIGNDAYPIKLVPSVQDNNGQPLARSPENRWFNLYSYAIRDGGSRDCVIRASNAETINISGMHQIYREGGNKDYRPRIEVAQLNTLSIGLMVSGVVWSGANDYSIDSLGNSVLDNRPQNDFATIGSLDVGCVSPTADLYFKDCALADFGDIMMGELHLPSLGTEETIRIGDRFGANALPPVSGVGDTLRCQLPNITYWQYTISQELTPRGQAEVRAKAALTALITESRLVDRGTIWIEGVEDNSGRIAAGLKGQIIINSAHKFIGPQEADTCQRGEVKILTRASSTAEPQLTTYATDQLAAEFAAPSYASRDVSLGGGAIGLVPFGFHGSQCVPPASADTIGNPFSQQVLTSHLSPVEVAFYGPIAARNDGQYASVEFREFGGSTWSPATTQFVQSLSSNSRSILLDAASSPATGPSVGFYRVSLGTTAASSSRCALTTNSPLLADSGTGPIYYFRLLCMSGGAPNPADLAGSTDANGNVFPDGVVDGTDFIAFLSAFSSNDLLADIVSASNTPPGDGVVDGSDFIAFVNAFSLGCE